MLSVIERGHVWKTCKHFSLFKVSLLVVVCIMWNIQPVNSWVKAVQESNTEFAKTNSEFAIHFTFALVTDTDLPMEISNFTCKNSSFSCSRNSVHFIFM